MEAFEIKYYLADLPDNLITRASNILKVYENKELKRDVKIQESLPIDDLMKEQKSPVEEELKKINILEVTPMDAMNILYQLKEKIN